MINHELYIFDLDETLLNGDSAMLWHQFLVKNGIIQDANFLQEDKRLMHLYAQGELDMQQYLHFSVAPITKMPTQKIDSLVEQFIHSEISSRIFSQARELIEQLQIQGKEIIIISATVDFLVAKIAQYLTVKNHLAINLQVENNCYSSEIKGVPTYQQGKVKRLKDWLKTQTNRYQTLYFYTDSINDLSLCEYANVVRVVNPCEALAIEAQENDWQMLAW